ncbi:hypothetical protein Syun_019550 [Stephania yunnanensis]|uniref:Uncharacterized protein n=1 Tax=Stephania yunnanensis TaxID=152371 RepID=A0AAP0IUD3_9MAGN
MVGFNHEGTSDLPHQNPSMIRVAEASKKDVVGAQQAELHPDHHQFKGVA